MSKTKLPTPAPVQLFVRCINAENRPANYVGDWPRAGCVYPVRVLPHVHTRQAQVHIQGFYAERPYGAFAPHRFERLAEVWLN